MTAMKIRWRRWSTRCIIGALALLAAGLLWGIGVRLTSPWRQIRIAELTDVVGSPAWSGSGLRIVAYNIAHGRGVNRSNWGGGTTVERAKRLDAIADLLRAQIADIVILNEVDFNCTWSGGVNQAQWIARRAGYRYCLEQRNLDTGWPFLRYAYGNAVLSRFPIVDAQSLPLPRHSVFESIVAGSKQAAWCTIEPAPGRRIAVVAVHFEHRREATRIASADRVLALITPDPLIAAGDFNSTLPGFPMANTDAAGRTALGVLIADGRFAHAVSSSPGPTDFTLPSWQPKRVIDWVLYPPSWSATSHVVSAGLLSDHLPVSADLRPPSE